MKIRITKDCKWSFSPSEPIESFKKDEVYDFINDKAEKMIKGNCASEDVQEDVQEDVKHETEAKAQPADENKMFTPEAKEDKSAKPKPKKAVKKGK
jgi:hypothetical protein